jgi:hypothetical protein
MFPAKFEIRLCRLRAGSNFFLDFARAHGMWTYEPRQGRNAATVVCSASAVVALAFWFWFGLVALRLHGTPATYFAPAANGDKFGVLPSGGRADEFLCG